MKKTALIIICILLCAGMMLGLSACSIEIKTDGKNGQTYTIDLGEIDLEEVAENISEALESIDLEEIRERLEEAGSELTQLFGLFMSQMEGSSAGYGSGYDNDYISSGGNDLISGIDDPEDADGSGLYSEELLDMLESILEANGLGEYSDAIMDEIRENPEILDELMNPEGLEELMGQLFAASLGSSGSQAQEEAEPAEDLEPAEDAGPVEDITSDEEETESAMAAIEAALEIASHITGEEPESISAFPMD